MKLILIILAVSLQVSAVTTVHSQQVTLTAKNTPLRDILQEIRKQTGYAFMYESDLLNNAKPVTIILKQSPIEETLQSIFNKQPYSYQIKDNFILITSKAEKKSEEMAPASANLPVTITGKVTDEDGKPLIGASVLLKGTSRGTTTNAEGRFTLNDVPDNGTLVIRMVGRETREILYKDASINNIVLKEINSELSEIQVIAYGSVDKKYLTSNAGTIKGEDIARQPVSNTLLSLQGRVPGLFITQTSGQTAGNVRVIIQGQNSITKGNDPFYVIDGIPYSPNFTNVGLLGENVSDGSGNSGGSAFNFINPSDIESVVILKDADATAIYGSRAANGAILITTKRGKIGRTKVDLNMQQGWGKITRGTNVLNTAQYLEMRKEAYRNAGQTAPGLDTDPTRDNYDLTVWDQNKQHNWQDELVGGTAKYTNAQISVSGGSERTQFLAGGGYNRQTTVYPNDLDDTKYNVHFNLNNSSENKKFNFMLNANFLQDLNNLNATDLMGKVPLLAPNAPDLFNADGTINWSPLPNNSGQYSFEINPMSFTKNRYQGTTNNLIGNSLISYEVLPGLTIKSTLGYNMLTGDEMTLKSIDATSPGIADRRGSSVFLNKSINSYIIEPQVTYVKETKYGRFDFLLGSTFQQSKSMVSAVEATGFANDAQLANVAAATTVIASPNRNAEALYKYNAVFARFNYRLMGKYILNLTARRDGSSRFGNENKLHNFYAVGGAWLFAEESLVKQILPFLSTGKIRINYGTTGNDQINDYAYLSLLTNSPYDIAYQNVVSLDSRGHANPILQWEETRKLNIGLDLGMLNDRFTLSANYFRNRSSNQLIDYQLPFMTGFDLVTKNFPATVQNTGLELLVDISAIKSNNFNWQLSFNATIPRNKLVEFYNIENSSYKETFVLGQPVNIKRLYKFAGVNPTTGLYQFLNSKGEYTSDPSFASDRTAMVNTNPKWYGGFSSSLTYKNFQFDILLQYVDQISESIRFFNNGAGIVNLNPPEQVLNRWQKDGDVKDVQKFLPGFSSSHSNARQSDALYTDGSFLRLKNVSFSYRVPFRVLDRLGASDARIYVQGQNLLTITNYFGADPETHLIGLLPPLKMYTVGLQITL